jgi:serine/threonine-protein kinase
MQVATSTAAPAPRLVPGARVANRYRIRRLVATGTACEVYEAEDEREPNRVALKVVHRPLDDTDRALEAFEVEAAAYARIDSPHVPKLYRIGTLRDGSRFMVLELLRGRPLAEHLAGGPLSLPTVVALGCQMLSALHAVHSADLVHCDVKPQNLLVEGEAPGLYAHLVDFGISVGVRKGSWRKAARADVVVGTPEYMSPEQAQGEAVDLRTDLYSAGVVLYQALTGRLPFSADSDRELMIAKLRDPVVPPRALRESCPIELERLLMRALCRDRRYRFSAAHRVLDELEWIRDRYGLRDAWTRPLSVHPEAVQSTPQAVTRPAASVGQQERHKPC